MRTANLFFSLLALATNVALIGVLIAAATPALRPRLRRHASAALPLAAVVATVSMLGSLYYSEVVGFRPCALCWYQRAAMYPLAVLLVTAVILRRPGWWRIGLPLALVGAVISGYHYLIQHVPSLALESACSASTPCTAAEVWQFGFISLAYMAGSAFLLIAALLWFGTRRVQTSARKQVDTGTRDGLMVATATLAVAGIVAALFTPVPAQAPQPAPVAANVTVVGAALPPFESPQSDPAVGQPMPDVTGVDYEGSEVSITDDGRPKIVIVMAHWCPHCQAEIPALQAWLDEHGQPEGVDLYSVSTAANPSADNYPPQEWLAREGWSVPVIADDEDSTAAQALGTTGYPYFVFVGSDGMIARRHSGELGPEALEEAIGALRSS